MEDTLAKHIAYDRPSFKLLAFLKKYYSLTDIIFQTNHFVIFKEFGLGMTQLGNRMVYRDDANVPFKLKKRIQSGLQNNKHHEKL